MRAFYLIVRVKTKLAQIASILILDFLAKHTTIKIGTASLAC